MAAQDQLVWAMFFRPTELIENTQFTLREGPKHRWTRQDVSWSFPLSFLKSFSIYPESQIECSTKLQNLRT